MKRLDEVIDAMERCSIPPCFDCKGCPYEDDDVEVGCRSDDRDADALHYLKTIETTENLYHDAVNELSKWKDEDWKDRCLPLTWDELRTMEGKPVWVEYGIGFNQKRWVVIHSFHNTGSFCYMNVSGNYPNTFWQKDMGEDEFWQAYRKERNETNFCLNCGADMREDIPIEYFENGGI